MTTEHLTGAAAQDATSPTPAAMRRAMGAFATGVTVVTAMDGDEPVGFACQSFASVSLEPPLVLFCADHRGRTWPRIRRAGQFCVNVLAEDQTDLCARFGSSRGLKFDGLDWDLTRWGTPSLRGVLMKVHAQVHAVHTAGDHDIVVGRVLGLDSGPGHRPLLFFRGRFDMPERQDVLDDGGAPGLWGWGDPWDLDSGQGRTGSQARAARTRAAMPVDKVGSTTGA
ncbi:flavin reductase family protein [Streptomyces sp. NPDC005012]|uniref:flavin reductase family protein n=1 Tax=Streptomyces sp. NPDC005012 TaxID=3154558 RepID=UPI0033ACD87F